MPNSDPFKNVLLQLSLAREERKATLDSIQRATGCSDFETIGFLVRAMFGEWSDERLETELKGLKAACDARRQAP